MFVAVPSKPHKNISSLESGYSGNPGKLRFFSLSFEDFKRQKLILFGEKNLDKIKVAVKQSFDTVDAIIFEAALTLNEQATKYKQKEYVS